MHVSLYTTQVIIQHNLNLLMQRLVNQGLIHHFEVISRRALRVRTKKPSADESADQQHQDGASITLHELGYIIVLVTIGQAVSVAVFVCELLAKGRWRRRRR